MMPYVRLTESNPLSVLECIRYRAWLPQIYRNTAGTNWFMGVESTGCADVYDTSAMPDEVRAKWNNYRDSGAYKWYEVWTANDNTSGESALFGIDGGDWSVMLARWTSKDTLATDEEIDCALGLIGGDDLQEEDHAHRAVGIAFGAMLLAILLGIGAIFPYF